MNLKNNKAAGKKLDGPPEQLLQEEGSASAQEHQDSDNGFEAWVSLSEAMMSSTPQPRTTLLRALLKFNFSGPDFKRKLLEWEIDVGLNDRISGTGEELPDTIKMAVIIDSAPGKLGDHLQVNAESYKSYAQVRMSIMSYLATRKFSSEKTESSGGDPMLVDAFKGFQRPKRQRQG